MILNRPPAEELTNIPDFEAPEPPPAPTPPVKVQETPDVPFPSDDDADSLGQRRGKSNIASEYLPNDEEADAIAGAANGKSHKPDSLPAICCFDDLVADEKLVIPPEIIKGFLHQGLKGVLGSSSKAMKTWVLVDAAMSVASGMPFWGMETIKGRVLYINFEIPGPFSKFRFETVAKAKGITSCPLLDIWNLRGHAASLDILEAEMIRRLKDGGYTLVIIDPIYKGLGNREENAAQDVAEICNELERIAVHTGAAVVYAAHFSKGNQAGKEALDRISGSGVWARDADSLMIMTAHEEAECFTIETVLRNLPRQDPFAIRWQFPLMQRDENLDPDKLKQSGGRPKEYSQTEILSFIKYSTKEHPISVSAWASAAGMKRPTLQEYLPAMRFNGLIATSGEGATARQYITEKGRLSLG